MNLNKTLFLFLRSTNQLGFCCLAKVSYLSLFVRTAWMSLGRWQSNKVKPLTFICLFPYKQSYADVGDNWSNILQFRSNNNLIKTYFIITRFKSCLSILIFRHYIWPHTYDKLTEDAFFFSIYIVEDFIWLDLIVLLT